MARIFDSARYPYEIQMTREAYKILRIFMGKHPAMQRIVVTDLCPGVHPLAGAQHGMDIRVEMGEYAYNQIMDRVRLSPFISNRTVHVH